MQRKETFTKVPRLIVLAFTVMLMGFVAAGCEGVPETTSPAVSPTTQEIAQAPSPTATASPTATPTPKPTTIPSSTPTPTKTPTPQPTATPTKQPTPEPEEPVEMVATGNVDLYLSPEGQKVGYFVPGQRFTPTGAEQDGWIQVVTSAGSKLWIQEGGPYGPVGEATPVPEVTPLPEHPFCPEIPPGFWNPYGGPTETTGIKHSPLWEYMGIYHYSLWGQVIDQGIKNSDGSISTRIQFNLIGTGLIEAEYILPPSLPIRRMINGENDTVDAPYISPSEVCQEDVVYITSISSPDVLDPRIPGPHVLDGPFYIMRFRQ